MSILVPFLAVLLVAGLAAYHRMRLATWAAISACALVACWLLGANAVACVVAAVIVPPSPCRCCCRQSVRRWSPRR